MGCFGRVNAQQTDFFLPDFDRVRVDDADVALNDMRASRRDNQSDDVLDEFFIALFLTGHFVKNPLIFPLL